MKKIYLHGKRGIGLFTLIDDEDFEKVNKYKWDLDKNGYAVTTINKGRIFLHRLIMNVKDKAIHIDHIGKVVYDKNNDEVFIANTLNNMKNNLRIATVNQNLYNTNIRKNNTSGYKGVSYDKITNKWQAAISKDGITYSLGRFPFTEIGKIEAAKAYNKKAQELFGEFAKLNKINDNIVYNSVSISDSLLNKTKADIILAKKELAIQDKLRQELINKKNIQNNLYKIDEEYAYIKLTSKYGENKLTIIDKEYVNDIAKYNWSCDEKNYAYRIENYKKIMLHREILFLHDNINIDERNNYNNLMVLHLSNDDIFYDNYFIANTLNNCYDNLQWACNNNVCKNNISGMKGVYKAVFYKGTEREYYKWQAILVYKNKKVFSELFEFSEEGKQLAAMAYNDAAKKYYGEFAFQNVIDKSRIKGYSIKINRLVRIKIDEENKNLIMNYKWQIGKRGLFAKIYKDGTLIEKEKLSKGRFILTRQILNMHPEDINRVIFLDGNKLNYCKNNLRIVYSKKNIEMLIPIDGKYKLNNPENYKDYLGNELTYNDCIDGWYKSSIAGTAVIQVVDRFMLIDIEDYEKVSKFQWRKFKSKIIIYNQRIYGLDPHKQYFIIEVIFGKDYKIKMINGNIYDCRKENIKILE